MQERHPGDEDGRRGQSHEPRVRDGEGEAKRKGKIEGSDDAAILQPSSTLSIARAKEKEKRTMGETATENPV